MLDDDFDAFRQSGYRFGRKMVRMAGHDGIHPSQEFILVLAVQNLKIFANISLHGKENLQRINWYSVLVMAPAFIR